MAVSTRELTRELGSESQVSGVGGYKNARVRDLIIKELSDSEKGYIAGLVDGEAWVGVTRRKLRGLKRPCYSPRIIVTNTNREVIEWLKETGLRMHL